MERGEMNAMGHSDDITNHFAITVNQKIFLGHGNGFLGNETGFHNPMYTDLDEVLHLIQIALEGETPNETEYHRTLESGAVEEVVVIEKEGVRKRLLFRLWPVLYGVRKRLEYRIYKDDKKINDIITYYLTIFARTNKAKLILKD